MIFPLCSLFRNKLFCLMLVEKHRICTWRKTTHPGSCEANGKGTRVRKKCNRFTSTSWQDQNGWFWWWFVVFIFFLFVRVSLIENSLDAIYWHCVDLILRYSWAPLFRVFCPFAHFRIMVLCRTNERTWKKEKFNFDALCIDAVCMWN